MCVYLLIVLAILISLTLIGNGIACTVIYNPNSIECNYIVYGGITLTIIVLLVSLIYYLKKRKNLLADNQEPRIVIQEKEYRNPIRFNKANHYKSNNVIINNKVRNSSDRSFSDRSFNDRSSRSRSP